MTPKILEEIIETITRILPAGSADVQKNLRAAMTSTFNRFDLVTREELDVQEQVLARTRVRLEEMEKRVAELEAKLKQ
ncbi:MAG TPA: accessory factor UbiK family protein [Burkholderiales bacterium]|nr:accessory factor UbiK family protein [Burkholderiales bacterium]